MRRMSFKQGTTGQSTRTLRNNKVGNKVGDTHLSPPLIAGGVLQNQPLLGDRALLAAAMAYVDWHPAPGCDTFSIHQEE